MTSKPLYPEIPAKSIGFLRATPKPDRNLIDLQTVISSSPCLIALMILLMFRFVFIINDFFIREFLND